jgi:hypothetical protein
MPVFPDGLRTLVATAVDLESLAAARDAFGELVRAISPTRISRSFSTFR